MPPTTAAVGDGCSRHPGGMTMPMGARQPWLSGTSWSTRHRRQYRMAEYATARCALVLPHTCGPVPVKSNTAERERRSIVIASAMGVPGHGLGRQEQVRERGGGGAGR